jgi:hypothetical protein
MNDDTQIIPIARDGDETQILRPGRAEGDLAASIRMAVAGDETTLRPSITGRPGPRGFYETLIATARVEASESNRMRLDHLDGVLLVGRDLWDEPFIDLISGLLVNSRLAYAAHLVTGPALVSLHSRLEPADRISGDLLDACMDWMRFAAHPALRVAAVDVLARNPVPALLRLTLTDVARMAAAGRWDRLPGSLVSAVSQIARIDAAGSEMAVQIAVACLLPPGRLPREENSAPGGMKTLDW